MTNSNTTESITDELLSTLSDEELENRLSAKEDSPATETVSADNEQTEEAKEPEQTEQPKQPANEEPTEQPEQTDSDHVKALEESKAKLEKQLANLQQVYGRQSNELGELRAKLKELKKPTQEDYDADTPKALEEQKEYDKVSQRAQELEQEQVNLSIVERNIHFAKQFSPDLEANAPHIYKILTEQDGFTHQQANEFLGQIFVQNPLTVYQLNKRVKEVKEIERLKAEINRLKQAPEKMLNKISKAASNGSNVAGTVSTPASRPELGFSDYSKLSDKELDNLISESLKNERI
jgi:uncharacterized small protein (DUF1192 family)